MIEEVARDWWVVVLHGILAVLFGLAAIFMPEMTLLMLIVLFGVFAIADGVTALVGVFRRHPYSPRWAQALHGVLSLAAGVVALFWPGVSAMALLWIIAVWAIAIGVLRIASAIALRKVIENEWMLALSGVLSLAFGVVALARPLAGALALLFLIAAYAIVFGIALIALGLRLHGIGKRRGAAPA